MEQQLVWKTEQDSSPHTLCSVGQGAYSTVGQKVKPRIYEAVGKPGISRPAGKCD